MGVATAYAVATTVLMPTYTHVVAKTVGLTATRFFGGLLGVARATAVMCVALVGLRLALVDRGLPPSARLAAVILAGVAVYIPLCLWQVPEVRDEIRRFRRPRRPQPEPSAGLSHQ